MKTLLFVLLENYSDWEVAYVSAFSGLLAKETCSIKTVALTKDNVHSLGGLTVVPDYDINSVTDDYDALLLIGGMSWRTEEAQQVKPLVYKAIENGKYVGGICDGSTFLGKIGVLNQVKHTSNDLEDLKQWAGEAYTGEKNYLMQQAVRDQKVITANGTAALEFAKEVLLALEIAPKEEIVGWYNFHKYGRYEAPMPQM